MGQAPTTHRLFILFCLLSTIWFTQTAYSQESYTIEAPELVLSGVKFNVFLPFETSIPGISPPKLRINSASTIIDFEEGENEDGIKGWLIEGAQINASDSSTLHIIENNEVIQSKSIRVIPGWFSIIPPVLAIVIALIFRRVIPALFLGIWVGAWGIAELTFPGLFIGLFEGFQIYVRDALADSSHASIILFTLMIGGMVGIISKNGGTQGIVNKIVKWANSPQRGQLVTWLLGLVVFFDDYANTLVVGKTMRPVTDKLRISREKLAYIVDSTAAPVASLALVTTWIGYEVGLIGDAAEKIGTINESAYSIFLNSLAYSFYPILALFFVFIVAYTRRDFGPMYKAELRARTTGQLSEPDAETQSEEEDKEIMPIPGKPQRSINAIIPVFVLVFGVITGLFVTGEGDNIRDIIGSADSYVALLWASLAGVLVAAILSISQRILTLAQTIESWYSGLKSMLFAMIILILAWSLSAVTEVLHTADYLVSVLGESLDPGLIPFLIFLLAAATGFSTGSSWGAMGILMPLVIPLTWAVMDANGIADPDHYYILYSTVSCVLAGSVWGDHCSPISDTTILSSMASNCDHIDHVRTQLPYALLVGGVAMLLGTLPTGYGFPWWVSLPLSAVILYTVLRTFGKISDDQTVTA